MQNIIHAGSAANEHAQEINEKVQYEANKNIVMNPNIPVGERAQGAVDAVGNKVSEKTHEVKKAYHQTLAGLTSDVVTGQGERELPSSGISTTSYVVTGNGLREFTTNESIKHAGSAAIEHAQEIDQKAQFEMNKNIAMNPNLPIGERAQGAVSAAGNKISETTHEVKKAYHQTQAGLTSDVVTGQGVNEYPSGVVPVQVFQSPVPTVESNIKQLGIAAQEHSLEIDQKQQFEVNKSEAINPNLPISERVQSAVSAAGNKMSEKVHEASKVLHQGLSGLTTNISTPFTDLKTPERKVDIKQLGIAAQEHSLEIDQRMRYEAHMNIATNPNFSVSERAQSAVEAAGFLVSEKAHEANKAYHQSLSGLAPEVLTAEGQREQNPTVKHAGIAATEHALEMDQKVQYELHKDISLNSNKPAGERAQAAVEAVGNLMSEKAHEVNKAYHQAQAGLMSDIKTGEGQHELVPTTSEKVRHAAMAATEHALEINQKQQFELNKNVATNEELTFAERTQAAVGAAGSKISELTHEASKKYHQSLAGVSSDVKTAYAHNTIGLSYDSETQNKPVPKRDIKQAGWAAKEHAQEIEQKTQFEEHKHIVMNSDKPIVDRAQAAVDAVGNLLSEKQHEASKVYYQSLSGLGTQDHTPIPDRPEDQIPIDKIKHAGIAAMEHSQEINQKAELELNKNLALNPEIPIGDRAQAALGAVGNKISAITHEANKAYHQSIAGVAPEVITQDLPVATEIQQQKSIKLEKIKHVGQALTEHSIEIDQKEQFEANKSLLMNPSLPVGDRAKAAFEALGNKISETFHESNKIYHQNLAGLKSDTDKPEEPTPSTKIVHAGIAATEHAQEISQKEQFELNKRIASNPSIAPVDRAQAAIGAVGNKISEKAHEASKVVHQNIAQMNELVE